MTHLWLIPLVVATGLGVVLSGVLLSPPLGRRIPNRWLGVLCALASVFLIEQGLTPFGWLRLVPHLAAASYGVPFLVGPVVLLYCRALGGQGTLRWVHLGYALPFLGFLAAQIPFYRLSAAEKTSIIINSLETGDYFLSSRHLVVTGAQLVVSIVFFWAIHRTHGAGDEDGNWTYERIRTAWIRRVTQLYGGFVLCLGAYWVSLMTGRYFALLCFVLGLSMMTHLLIIALWALQRPEIVHGALRTPREPQYATSGLTDEALRQYVERLKKVMETERLYLDPHLRAGQVADAARMARHHLSQALNQQLGINFARFVNGYRIDLAKTLLRSKPRLGVLEIAHRVGFNSKNAFQAAFKRHCGTSPSEFRRPQKGET
ncbi:MAG: helix-turn-helix domain-containing protein [Thermoanaerobaculia bacterium]|nr:helix-turn-helix domain-containing protein [Thermoanaerobaculia bacterium]